MHSWVKTIDEYKKAIAIKLHMVYFWGEGVDWGWVGHVEELLSALKNAPTSPQSEKLEHLVWLI